MKLPDDIEFKRSTGSRFTEQSVLNILEFSPGLACCYRDGRILTMNSGGASLLGYSSRDDFEDTLFDDLLSHEYANMGIIERVRDEQEPCLAMLRRKDGSNLKAEIRIQLARELGAGTLIVRAEDVSDRVFLGSNLQESEMRFRDLVDNAMDMICSCSGGNITFINRAGLELIGAKNPDEIIGQSVTTLFHSDYHEVLSTPDALAEIIEEEDFFPVRLARRDGSHLDVHIALNLTHNSAEGEFMLEARDITAHRKAVMALHQMNKDLEQRVQSRTQELTDEIGRRKETEERLRQSALHDGLTGLPNRQLLMERLDQAIQRGHRYGKKVAILFIDLDGFKKINDTQGHEAGDILLKNVSNQFQNMVRETDTVARLGGDEFIIAYTDISDPKEALILGQRIIDSFKDINSQPGGSETDIGASIGIALYPDHVDTSEELIKIADKAMYEVKKHGKNNFLMAPLK